VAYRPPPPPSPPSRTKWTRLVHPSVLIGHVLSTLRRRRMGPLLSLARSRSLALARTGRRARRRARRRAIARRRSARPRRRGARVGRGAGAHSSGPIAASGCFLASACGRRFCAVAGVSTCPFLGAGASACCLVARLAPLPLSCAPAGSASGAAAGRFHHSTAAVLMPAPAALAAIRTPGPALLLHTLSCAAAAAAAAAYGSVGTLACGFPRPRGFSCCCVRVPAKALRTRKSTLGKKSTGP